MITLPEKFARQIRSANTSLIPLVIINNEHYLSTNSIRFDGNNYLPLIKNIPVIKESVDFETRKYRISNVTLQIYNNEYLEQRFSDRIGNTSLMNATVEIYFKSDLATDGSLDDCLRVYIGYIQDYKHDEESADITLEDKSQLLLDQKLPIQKTADNNNLAERYRNTYVPMVYGNVDRSRCVQDYQEDLISGTQKLFISDSTWGQGLDSVYALTSGVYGLIMPWNRYYPFTTGAAAESTPQYSLANDGVNNVGNYILFRTYEGNLDPRRNAIANNHCEIAVKRHPVNFEGGWRTIIGGNHPHGWYDWDDPNDPDAFIQIYWYESEKLKMYDTWSGIYPQEEVDFPAHIFKRSTTPLLDIENIWNFGTRRYMPENFTPNQVIPLPAEIAQLEESSEFGSGCSHWSDGNRIGTHSRAEIDWEFDNAIPNDELLNVVQLENGDVYQPEMPCYLKLSMFVYGKHLKYYSGSNFLAIGSANLSHAGDLRYICYFDIKNDNQAYASDTLGGNYNPDASLYNVNGTDSGYRGLFPHIHPGSSTSAFFHGNLVTDHKENSEATGKYGDLEAPVYFFGDGNYQEGLAYSGVEGLNTYYSLDDYLVGGKGYESDAFKSSTNGGHSAIGGGDAHTDPMSHNDVTDYGYAWIGNVHDMNDNIRFQFDAATLGDPSINHEELSDVYDQIPSFPNHSQNIGENGAIYGFMCRVDELEMYTYAILKRFDDKEIYANVRGRVDRSDLRYTGGNVALTTQADRVRNIMKESGVQYRTNFEYGDPNMRIIPEEQAKQSYDKKGSLVQEGYQPNPDPGSSGGGT